MRVRAKADCFAANGRRRKGAVFEFNLPEGGSLPSFLEEVEPDAQLRAADPVPVETPQEISLGQLARAKPATVNPQTVGAPQTGDPAEADFLK